MRTRVAEHAACFTTVALLALIQAACESKPAKTYGRSLLAICAVVLQYLVAGGVSAHPRCTDSSHSMDQNGVDAYRCANKMYTTMIFSCMGNANVERLRLLLQWPLLTA